MWTNGPLRMPVKIPSSISEDQSNAPFAALNIVEIIREPVQVSLSLGTSSLLWPFAGNPLIW
jgi:hypothetical protein